MEFNMLHSNITTPFSFNFQSSSLHDNLQLPPQPQPSLIKKESNLMKYSCESILVIGEQLHLSPTLSFYKRHTSDIKYTLATTDSIIHESNDIIDNTDLIAGVYEGGFKTWECSLDLCLYMDTQFMDLKGMDVLEVGCGSGLPGILALKKGAKVDFQDYVKLMTFLFKF